MDQRFLLASSIVTCAPMLGQHADGERTAAVFCKLRVPAPPRETVMPRGGHRPDVSPTQDTTLQTG